MKHPAILQIRGATSKKEIGRIVGNSCLECDFEDVKGGMNIYISDVRDARTAINKIKKALSPKSKFNLKMSTKYAGLRNGKVRVLFVYSLRFES